MSSNQKLKGKKVAILATDGFEQSELIEPQAALKEAGATVEVISLKAGHIRGWNKDTWGDEVAVDKSLADASPKDYNALVLPGGLFNPDTLRTQPEAVEFVKGFFGQQEIKPVGAICHGPWLLAEADVLKDRKVTSFPSIQTDLKNAGANWVNEEVVVDEGLVTSRKPADLAAFNKKLVEEIAEGRHAA